MKIGASIKKLRKKINISQGKLAKLVNISQTYLSLIEKDKKTPSTELLENISKHLGVPMYYIMFNALEIEKDIVPEKQEAYKLLKPAISGMIEQFFIDE